MSETDEIVVKVGGGDGGRKKTLGAVTLGAWWGMLAVVFTQCMIDDWRGKAAVLKEIEAGGWLNFPWQVWLLLLLLTHAVCMALVARLLRRPTVSASMTVASSKNVQDAARRLTQIVDTTISK